MTDLKFNLLGMLYSANPVHPLREYDLLNSGFGTFIEIDHAMSDLLQQGFISGKVGSDIIEITSSGRDAYEQAQEERCQQAEQKRQQRFDNKISIASVLIPCITFILGLVLGSQFNLVDRLISLFSE